MLAVTEWNTVQMSVGVFTSQKSRLLQNVRLELSATPSDLLKILLTDLLLVAECTALGVNAVTVIVNGSTIMVEGRSLADYGFRPGTRSHCNVFFQRR